MARQKHDACGLCPICDKVCRHQRPCICDGRNEPVLFGRLRGNLDKGGA